MKMQLERNNKAEVKMVEVLIIFQNACKLIFFLELGIVERID